MRPALRFALLISILAISGAGAACPEGARCQPKAARSAPTKPDAKRFEPYDPDRTRPANRPGFVDVGGGTEVRVGGRTRVEYNATR